MTGHVERGVELFEQRAWAAASSELATADAESPLAVEHLERLAISAYMVGRFEDSVGAWQRAHRALESTGELKGAARCAFWLAFMLLNDGELARGTGWVRRSQRLLDRIGTDCVERGYVEYCAALRCAMDGDLDVAVSEFAVAAGVGESFGNQELATLARVGQGRCLIGTGHVARGMALLDEAMATIAVEEISPTALGDLYCTVIEGCHQVFDTRRAQEWTEALNRWCESQPDLVLYRGQCLVHRAELMLLSGQWSDALTEVERACDRLSRPRRQPALGAAYYVRGELHRLFGREAEAAVRRGLEEAGPDPVAKARLLGPYVEIALATGDVAKARVAAEELSRLAAGWSTPYLDAVSAYASGSVLLVEGETGRALAQLRRARAGWVELEAPHEAARARVLVAEACRALGDETSAGLELDAALSELARLGVPVSTGYGLASAYEGGLTVRELDVLRQLATGKSNRAVASALFISEKTVATHVSSILRKLEVGSRAGATAYAHRHRLV